MNKPNKSYVIIEDLVEEDIQLGGFDFGKEVLVPNGDWTPWLPTKEKQRRGFESMACTDFSSTSTVETYMNFLTDKAKISVGNMQWAENNGYFDENGNWNFSDRFDAIVSGTSGNGNSLKAVAHAKHKYGLIPEKMLPWTDNKQKYFDKNSITQDMYALGAEFLKRFPINYERVARKDFDEALKYSPLAGACYAWNGIKDGVFFRVPHKINHAIEIIKRPDIWNIFDSYLPFIKKLANNYLFLGYAYRYIIRENVIEDEPKKKPMKTIKFKTIKHIYKIDNLRPKEIMRIGGWNTYQEELKRGWIEPFEVIGDEHFAGYKVVSGEINISYGIFSKVFQMFGAFK